MIKVLKVNRYYLPDRAYPIDSLYMQISQSPFFLLYKFTSAFSLPSIDLRLSTEHHLTDFIPGEAAKYKRLYDSH